MQNPASQQQNRGADRVQGLTKPTIWSKFAALALETKPTNLGQGFPSWSPPEFFLENLIKDSLPTNQQYTRAYGLPYLVQTIAEFYSPIFKRELDAMTNVLVANGGVTCLNTIFQAIINPGDEVILIDPSYDCYAAQIQMAGGVSRSVPLKPRFSQNKNELKQKENRYVQTEKDFWEINFELIKSTINDKTKAIVLNSPHNPTGKVFSQQEYEQIAEILKNYPNCIVIEDMVYEHLTFDTCEPFTLPRMSLVEGMFDRCLSVSSAGKLFSATGIRVGWVIGPVDLMQYLFAVHQYNIFCMNPPGQQAVADSLVQSKTNNYFKKLNDDMIVHRNLLIDQLVEGDLDVDIWIPQGGYFILADIKRLEVDQQYYTNKYFEGWEIKKDLAYAIQCACQKYVLPIPCSVFYQPETKKQGETLVRYAFCKTKDMIEEAGQKWKQN